MIPRPIRVRADGSYLARIPPNAYARQADRDGPLVRVIRYTPADPRRVGHGEGHVPITNLFDEAHFPASELIALCHERREEGLVFDEQETHQDPRRATEPAQVRGEAPAAVVQEV